MMEKGLDKEAAKRLEKILPKELLLDTMNRMVNIIGIKKKNWFWKNWNKVAMRLNWFSRYKLYMGGKLNNMMKLIFLNVLD